MDGWAAQSLSHLYGDVPEVLLFYKPTPDTKCIQQQCDGKQLQLNKLTYEEVYLGE